MKHHNLFLLSCTLSALFILNPVTIEAREKQDKAQQDSIAAKLVERFEAASWKFVPRNFTGANNIDVDFINSSSNSVTAIGDIIVVNLDFIGARVSAAGTTRHQRGRALAEAATAVRYNGRIPDYIRTTGEITDKEVIVKKKSINIKIKYIITESNLSRPRSTAEATLYINPGDLSCRLVLGGIDVDGDFEGKITLL